MKRGILIAPVVIAGALWAVQAKADLSMEAGFECDIFQQASNSSAPTTNTVTGQYNKTVSPKNLKGMMAELHKWLRRHYPPGFDDSGNNKVKCDYRDANGKGNFSVYFFIDASGNPYGAYIP